MNTTWPIDLDKACTAWIHFLQQQLVYSTMLFLAIWAVARLLKNRGAWWHMMLWSLVLLRLVVPPGLSSPLSARHLLEQLTPERASLASLLNVDSASMTPFSRAENKTQAPLPVPSDSPGGVVALILPGPATQTLRWWPYGAAGLWLTGAVLTALALLRKRRGFRQAVQGARPVIDQALLAMMDSWRRQLKLRRRPRLVSADTCLSPFTIGIARPVIFLPASLLTTAGPKTLEAVLAHEMVHIKHKDDGWIKLQNLIQVIYFFHPVVWYANRQLHLARESTRDAEVLATGLLKPSDYGHGLIRVLQSTAARGAAGAVLAGFGQHRHHFERRIKRIGQGRGLRQSTSRMVSLWLILAGLVLLPMAPVPSSLAIEYNHAVQRGLRLINELEGWFANRFDPDLHRVASLPTTLQDQQLNPNLKAPHYQLQDFQAAAAVKGEMPGVIFVTGGAPVRAVAAGIVHFIGEKSTQAEAQNGFYVRIAHDTYDDLRQERYPRVTLYRSQAFRSTYYGLSAVLVSHWQAVKRGQVIGYGAAAHQGSEQQFKLVLEERGNIVNPDHFGRGHDFMTWWDGGAGWEVALDEMNRRLDEQRALVAQFNAHYERRDTDNIYHKIHTVVDTEKFNNYPVKWSTVDRFRYLTWLFRQAPQRFTGLTPSQVDAMTRAFNAAQPILLTLPFAR